MLSLTSCNSLGFIAEPPRTCVGVTRARCLLLIFMDLSELTARNRPEQRRFTKMLEWLKDRGLVYILETGTASDEVLDVEKDYEVIDHQARLSRKEAAFKKALEKLNAQHETERVKIQKAATKSGDDPAEKLAKLEETHREDVSKVHRKFDIPEPSEDMDIDEEDTQQDTSNNPPSNEQATEQDTEQGKMEVDQPVQEDGVASW